MIENIEDIRATMQALRKEAYPDLPADLIHQILQIESEHVNDPKEATRRIEGLVNDHLEEA